MAHVIRSIPRTHVFRRVIDVRRNDGQRRARWIVRRSADVTPWVWPPVLIASGAAGGELGGLLHRPGDGAAAGVMAVAVLSLAVAQMRRRAVHKAEVDALARIATAESDDAPRQ
jgi:hypothetical protein